MVSYRFPAERLPLERFFELTASKRLSPGRVPLLKHLEKSRKILEEYGIRNLAELIAALKNKERIRSMAVATGIPGDYLVLLAREAKSYLTRDYPLAGFPGIPFEFTEVLKSAGIRNTKDFFESAQDQEERHRLSRSTGIPESRMKELLSLCDLTRITGVGPVYARILYHAGIRSLSEFLEAGPISLYEIQEGTRTAEITTFRPLSEEEIRYCVDYARVVMEYSEF